LSLPQPLDQWLAIQDYRTAFLINCGANTDVRKLLDNLGDSARRFVRLVFIDSHRPIHHSLNNDDDNSCVLLHDPDCGDVPLESIPLSSASVDENTGERSLSAHFKLPLCAQGADVLCIQPTFRRFFCAVPPARRRKLDSGEGMTVSTVTAQEHEPVRYLPSEWFVFADDGDPGVELDEYYQRGSQYGVPASVVLFQLAHTMQLGGPYVLWYVPKRQGCQLV
jgi:hypothetical protein